MDEVGPQEGDADKSPQNHGGRARSTIGDGVPSAVGPLEAGLADRARGRCVESRPAALDPPVRASVVVFTDGRFVTLRRRQDRVGHAGGIPTAAPWLLHPESLIRAISVRRR